MFLALKEVIVITIAIISGVVAGFGFSPGAVFAPDLPPPAIVFIQEPVDSENTPAVVREETDTTIQENRESVPQAQIISQNAPRAPVDPLTELADALAQLVNEPQTGVPRQAPARAPQEVNEVARGAIVNIICTTQAGGPVRPISGSGVVIDSGGTILTNAHVAQYFLLKDYPSPGFVECSIRTGSPARPAYRAELLFLPPSWIRDNAQKIDDATPVGNGEHDWALIRITGIINPGTPTSLPALALATTRPETGDPVIAAGYPAGFLGGITIARDLYAASAQSVVGQLYTFGDQTIDLFSVGGTIVAQQGSSGGAVVNMDGVLTGLIVTTTDASVTADRDLRAITTEYIIRDFQSEVGTDIQTFFSLNLNEQGRIFRETIAPSLTQALVRVLEN